MTNRENAFTQSGNRPGHDDHPLVRHIPETDRKGEVSGADLFIKGRKLKCDPFLILGPLVTLRYGLIIHQPFLRPYSKTALKFPPAIG